MFFIFIAFLWFITCQSQEAPNHQNNEETISSKASEDKVEDTPICGGFLEFDIKQGDYTKKSIDYSKIYVHSYTMDMILKETTNLAASGYYFLPVYENEPFIWKISGPFGMSFEPEQYVFAFNEGDSTDGTGEENTVKNYCSKDINFKFLGYSVEGQISTFGSNEGPEGLSLGLFNKNNEKIQTTLTTQNGLFKFKGLYPKQKFTIKPTEKFDIFDKKHQSYEFEININKSNFINRALIIKGYRLSGEVLSEHNQPMENALIAIYSFNTTLMKDYECTHKYLSSDEVMYKSFSPFCIVNSAKNGKFYFNNIPYGEFIIRPMIKNEHLIYSLTPEMIKVNIKHVDYKIPEAIRVNAFSIYGRVLNNKGNGLEKVIIKIDGQVKAVTDKNGVYILEKVSEGNYDLEAQAEDIFFEPLTNWRLTAELASIQDIYVNDYRLCGKIIIEATEFFTISKRTVVLQDTTTKKERRTITDQGGKYCFEVKPGNYTIYPVLTQEEKTSDLHLQPEQHELEIFDHPILDANFYQSKVKISGRVICLDKCKESDGIKVKLISTKSDKIQTAELRKDFSFEFTNILSGHYKLSIIKPEWCWQNEDIIIKIQNTDNLNQNFEQIGYSLFYTSKHNIDIQYVLKSKANSKGDIISIDKTKEKICLPKQGVYTITPKSCYMFKDKEFVYDTNNTTILEFIPIEFKVNGKVEIDGKTMDLLKQKNITEFKITLNIEEIDKESGARKHYKTFDVGISNKKTNFFNFYTEPNRKLIVTPSVHQGYIKIPQYQTLLFTPMEKEISIFEECSTNASNMEFDIQNGIIITGQVQPPLSEITITAWDISNSKSIMQSTTDKDGKYKIGPLSSNEKYEIKASKEGYKILQDEANKYNFKAEKLSFLKIRVQDTEGKPLSGVFLSLSSSDRGFRVNNSTNNEGYYNFLELYSGEYYIKPLFKEYEFTQQQELIKIKGGEHYDKLLVAKRVAFSIMGKVSNLNKEKIEGWYIQAINTKTKQIQETVIDKNGEYRLRGLIPGEKYDIRVKIPSQSNIEKSLPSSIPILVGKSDTTNVEFVVWNRSKKIDMKVYLNYTDDITNSCPIEKVSNLYVELTKPDDSETHIIKTISIPGYCWFAFRNLDKAKYHFKIFERPPKKSSDGTKLIYEDTIDMSDERGISNGEKVVDVLISKVNKGNLDSLNYTIYSPLCLFILICSILKWEYTVWVFSNFILGPFEVVMGFFIGKSAPVIKSKNMNVHRKKKN